MKTSIVFLMALVSFNAFSAQVGEDKKGECIFSEQSNKREAKVVEAPVSKEEVKKEATQTKSK